MVVLAFVCGCGGPSDGPGSGRGPDSDPARSARASVLLITVDTLRADRLGCYGHPRPVSPAIDRLARGGVLFEQAISSSCFTAPSMASLSTGLYPMQHGVVDWGRRGAGVTTTAAEAFAAAGYRTAFFSAHGAIGGIDAITRGFDRMIDDGDLDAATLTATALEWMKREPGPYFLWVHYFDPHAPYAPPETRARRKLPVDVAAQLPDYLPPAAWAPAVDQFLARDAQSAPRILPNLYDGEISVVDAAISDLITAARANASGSAATVGSKGGSGGGRGGGRGPIVAFSADHGENLADHRPFFAHRNVLYDSLVRVPLIVAAPGLAARRVPDMVPAFGLIPTLLELAGAPVPDSFEIGSLAARARGLDRSAGVADGAAHDGGVAAAGTDSAPGAAADAVVFLDSGLQDDPHKAIRTSRYKLTLRLRDGTSRLYDLRADPGERRALAVDPDDARMSSLRGALDAWIARERQRQGARETDLTPQERRRLEQLGYFDD